MSLKEYVLFECFIKEFVLQKSIQQILITYTNNRNRKETAVKISLIIHNTRWKYLSKR